MYGKNRDIENKLASKDVHRLIMSNLSISNLFRTIVSMLLRQLGKLPMEPLL